MKAIKQAITLSLASMVLIGPDSTNLVQAKRHSQQHATKLGRRNHYRPSDYQNIGLRFVDVATQNEVKTTKEASIQEQVQKLENKKQESDNQEMKEALE